MKILLLSERGESLNLALSMIDAGHQLSMWIKDPPSQFWGLGIVPLVPSWIGLDKQADLIVLDSPFLGDLIVDLDRSKTIFCSKIDPFFYVDPRARVACLTRAGFHLPPLTINAIEDLRGKPQWPCLVHLLNPPGPSAIVRGTWEELHKKLPVDQIVMVVGLPPGDVQFDLMFLWAGGKPVSRSVNLLVSSGPWTFAMGIEDEHKLAAYTAGLSKCTEFKSYNGPVTLRLMGSEDGIRAHDVWPWFDWRRFPIWRRRITAPNAAELIKLMHGGAVDIALNKEHCILFDIEVPPFAEVEVGVHLPGLEPGAGERMHPFGVYRDQGRYHVASDIRLMGTRSWCGLSYDKLKHNMEQALDPISAAKILASIQETILQLRMWNIL